MELEDLETYNTMENRSKSVNKMVILHFITFTALYTYLKSNFRVHTRDFFCRQTTEQIFRGFSLLLFERRECPSMNKKILST